MGQHYHEGSARVNAWEDTVQEMEGKKVYPKNGLYLGKPQVVHLKWKCTGTPIAVDKLDYPRPLAYCVKMRNDWPRQCNCIVIIKLLSAENHVASELEVNSGFIDFFGINSSQSQDNPPTPTPRCRKRKSEERHEVGDESKNNDDDGGGGRRVRGYSDTSRGGGKRKSAFRGVGVST